MSRCIECGFGWSWRLADGRLKCRRCGSRWRIKSLWDLSRFDSRAKTELVQRFVWGVPVYRQRFSRVAGAACQALKGAKEIRWSRATGPWMSIAARWRAVA